MKIDFDTSNTAEVAAVLALVRSLSGEAVHPARTTVSLRDAIEAAIADLGDDDGAPTPPYITTPEHAAGVAARNAEPIVIEGNHFEGDLTRWASEHPDAVQDDTPEQPVTDSNGREWDERIHSSSRATNGDGTWRYKRRVDKALVAEIEGADVGEPQQVASVPPPPPVAPAPTESAEAVATTAPEPAPADVPPPPPAASALTFADLMKRIGAAKRDGTLTDGMVASYCGALGIGGLADLASRADLVPAFGELVS